jgi:thiol:disulfide interchange protein
MKKKVLYWFPRILSIIFILFLSVFSLDIFEGNYGFWGTILGLFMHNIPSIILLIILIISWKHEIVGGIAFILAGILYIVWAVNYRPEMEIIYGILLIAGPAFLIGVLWFLNWKKRKKLKKNNRKNRKK